MDMDTKRRGKPAKKKKSKKGKKKKPIDDAAAELAAENEKKELVESLMAKTDLMEEEILAAYEDFYEKYPRGEINEKQFLQQSKVIGWQFKAVIIHTGPKGPVRWNNLATICVGKG